MEYKYGRWGVLPCLQICYERRTLLHVDAQITLRSLSTARGVVRTQCVCTGSACVGHARITLFPRVVPHQGLYARDTNNEYLELSVFYRSPIYVVHSIYMLVYVYVQ